MFVKCLLLESLQECLNLLVKYEKKIWYVLSAEHHPALEANKVPTKSLHYLSVAINGRLENYVCWKENSHHAEVSRRRKEEGQMVKERMRRDSERGSGSNNPIYF